MSAFRTIAILGVAVVISTAAFLLSSFCGAADRISASKAFSFNRRFESRDRVAPRRSSAPQTGRPTAELATEGHSRTYAAGE